MTSIAKKQPAKIKILKRHLVQYEKDEEQRKRLSRDASKIGSRHKKLEKSWIEYVDQNAEGGARLVNLFGFELSVEQKARRFDHRAKLVELLGEEAVEKLEAKTEMVDKLQVRRAA